MSPASRVLWRPYTQEKLSPASITLARAAGAYLYDRDGRRFLDGVASWWVITHGHCEPHLVAALQAQATTLDQALFAAFSHEAAEALATHLSALVPPPLTRVFLSDNGSTAVEAALKMALQYWRQRGQPQRQRFVALAGGYHGDTVGAMSVSGRSVFTQPYATALFDVLHATHPTAHDASPAAYAADAERLIATHGAELAAIILEPLVQGAGGMIMWPVEAVQRIIDTARRHGVLVIFDEVMTGFGRTGTMFAMDRLARCPDLLCLSKGLTGGVLPLGATLATDEIYAAFYDDDKRHMLFHGHSFTGNPLACAAARANLQLLAARDYRPIWANLEDTHQHALATLASTLPIVNPRVMGTIGAFDLPAEDAGYLSQTTTQLTSAMLAQGLFVRPLGSTIYLMPPYCTTPDELAGAWATIGAYLRATL